MMLAVMSSLVKGQHEVVHSATRVWRPEAPEALQLSPRGTPFPALYPAGTHFSFFDSLQAAVRLRRAG